MCDIHLLATNIHQTWQQTLYAYSPKLKAGREFGPFVRTTHAHERTLRDFLSSTCLFAHHVQRPILEFSCEEMMSEG